MPIMIGSTKIKKLAIGSTPIKKVMVGSDLVWSANPNVLLGLRDEKYLHYSLDNGTTWTADNTFVAAGYADLAGIGFSNVFYTAQARPFSSSYSTSHSKLCFCTSPDVSSGWTTKYTSGDYYYLSVNSVYKRDNIVLISIKYKSDGSYIYRTLRSIDGGVTFTMLSTTLRVPLAMCIWFKGKIYGLCSNSNKLYYTAGNAASWSGVTIGSSSYTLRHACTDGETLIVVNSNGYTYKSTNGTTWTSVSVPSDHSITTCANGYWIAEDQCSYKYSTDLVNWTNGSTGSWGGTWNSINSLLYDGVSYKCILYQGGSSSSTTKYSSLWKADSLSGTWSKVKTIYRASSDAWIYPMIYSTEYGTL